VTTAPGTAPDQRSNFMMRVAAAAVLAPLALALAYIGGWLWVVLAILVAVGLYSEWAAIVGASRAATLAVGMLGLAVAGLFAGLGGFEAAVCASVLGALAAGMTALPARRLWVFAGIVYAAVSLLASVILRRDAFDGFTAVMFVLLLVWATDSGGYFAGRAIGGPKLWPRISPKKTWSGAVGGFAGALIVAGGFAAAGEGRVLPLLAVAALLSVASQCGDLFESAVKRRFDVKDSGRLIPGHGGLLDRLDGFIAAVLVAALIGLVRGGSDGAGRGLMVW
jgi:phosphatidate cytidylyltransferase